MSQQKLPCQTNALPRGELRGAASKRGAQYEVVNGVRIPKFGGEYFDARAEEGAVRGITAQVCDVDTSLLSVGRVVRSGRRVVFADDSYIEDKVTGAKMWLGIEEGMCALEVWVPTTGF